jgi:hypothetical protein
MLYMRLYTLKYHTSSVGNIANGKMSTTVALYASKILFFLDSFALRLLLVRRMLQNKYSILCS